MHVHIQTYKKANFSTFVSNTPFLYHLKISGKRNLFSYCRRVEKGCIGDEWVNSCVTKLRKNQRQQTL